MPRQSQSSPPKTSPPPLRGREDPASLPSASCSTRGPFSRRLPLLAPISGSCREATSGGYPIWPDQYTFWLAKARIVGVGDRWSASDPRAASGSRSISDSRPPKVPITTNQPSSALQDCLVFSNECVRARSASQSERRPRLHMYLENLIPQPASCRYAYTDVSKSFTNCLTARRGAAARTQSTKI
jgi:hypothetical protein